MQEEWKQIIIDGIEYNYLISTHGRVFSLKTQKILKNRDTSKGYYRVALGIDGKTQEFLVHRLVAYTFIPNDDPVNKIEVNHIDENPKNNHVTNLEWCTSKYNVNYGKRTERQIRTYTEKHSRPIRCVETGEEFKNVSEVGKKHGLDTGSLCHCLSGRRKTCGGFHWEYI